MTDIFEIEAIIGHKIDEKGNVLFRIRWKGYPHPKDHTWEPRENLLCPATLNSYLRQMCDPKEQAEIEKHYRRYLKRSVTNGAKGTSGGGSSRRRDRSPNANARPKKKTRVSKQSTTKQDTILNDILLNVFSFLSDIEVARVRRVSSSWNHSGRLTILCKNCWQPCYTKEKRENVMIRRCDDCHHAERLCSQCSLQASEEKLSEEPFEGDSILDSFKIRFDHCGGPSCGQVSEGGGSHNALHVCDSVQHKCPKPAFRLANGSWISRLTLCQSCYYKNHWCKQCKHIFCQSCLPRACPGHQPPTPATS